MLSNHLQNGSESDNRLWARVPDSDDASTDGVGLLSSPRDGGGGVDSLDYEVIENYAYREEQVSCLLTNILPPSLLLIHLSL